MRVFLTMDVACLLLRSRYPCICMEATPTGPNKIRIPPVIVRLGCLEAQRLTRDCTHEASRAAWRPFFMSERPAMHMSAEA